MGSEQVEKINKLSRDITSYLELRITVGKPELCKQELEEAVCLLQEVLSTIYVKTVEAKKEKQKRNLSPEERQRRVEQGKINGRNRILENDSTEEKERKQQQRKIETDALKTKWEAKKLELESGKLVKVSH